MRVLRAIQPAIKVTAVFALVLSTASSLILMTPRTTHAEGFLLDTVRCLVRTVLVAGCRPAETPAQPQSQPQQPAPSQAPSQQPASPSSPASQAPSGQSSSGAQAFEPVVVPEAVTGGVPEIQPVTSAGSSSDRITESEYVSYFNAYSPYAVQGAQTHNEAAIVQTSPEGWKIAGIAWYWWGLLVAFIFALFFSVKYGILRRHSVLLKGE